MDAVTFCLDFCTSIVNINHTHTVESLSAPVLVLIKTTANEFISAKDHATCFLKFEFNVILNIIQNFGLVFAITVECLNWEF